LPLPPFIVATVMIVLIAYASPALKATNHPSQGYRLLVKLPTLCSGV
jgi:hypothetical protein